MEYQSDATAAVQKYLKQIEAKIAVAHILIDSMREEEWEGQKGDSWNICTELIRRGLTDMDGLIHVLHEQPEPATPPAQLLSVVDSPRKHTVDTGKKKRVRPTRSKKTADVARNLDAEYDA